MKLPVAYLIATYLSQNTSHSINHSLFSLTYSPSLSLSLSDPIPCIDSYNVQCTNIRVAKQQHTVTNVEGEAAEVQWRMERVLERVEREVLRWDRSPAARHSTSRLGN